MSAASSAAGASGSRPQSRQPKGSHQAGSTVRVLYDVIWDDTRWASDERWRRVDLQAATGPQHRVIQQAAAPPLRPP